MNHVYQAIWTRSLVVKYAALLLALCLLSYWPLTFGLFSLKNDAIFYFLPTRYTISEYITNGYWPFWSPYHNLGYPVHTDMQAGVWNPVVQLFSLFGPYTLQTLSYETLLYVYLSGLGMLLLLKHFNIHPGISLLFAVAYMLCGFNSDAAQFLCWIAGAAFLPFVFLFYYRMLTEGGWKVSSLFGFFFYVLFTAGYAGQFILITYLLLGLTIWHFYTNRYALTYKHWFSFGKLLLLAVLVFLLLSLPAILSYWFFLQTVDRGTGVSYELAMSNPLHPLLLFSYVLPLPVWRAPYVAITDPLLRNLYIGIVPFLLLLVSLVTKFDNKLLRFLKWTLFLSFLFSLGELGALRSLCYYVLPLMNTFRHPGLIKFIMNFNSCLLGAFCLQYYLHSRAGLKQKRIAFATIISIALVMLVWAVLEGNFFLTRGIFTTVADFTNKMKLVFDKLSFADAVLLNLLIQLPFIVLVYYFFVRKIHLKALVWGSLVNCMIHAALFQPFTVVRKQSANVTQSLINQVIRKGFPAPDLHATIHSNTRYDIETVKKDGPLNTYSKEIAHSYNITNPSRLKTHNKLWNNKTMRELVFSYPLLYRADTIIQLFDSTHTYKKKIALLEHQLSTSLDSFIPYKASFEKYTPNNWVLSIESNKPGFYCLQQNIHPNWKLYIDGHPSHIIPANYTFIGVLLNEGKHTVELKYEPPLVKVAYVISSILSILIIMATINWTRKKGNTLST